jgi:pullulanase
LQSVCSSPTRLFFPDVAADPEQYVAGGLPRITRVLITGDFQVELGHPENWDLATAPEMTLTSHPQGLLYVYAIPHLPDGFYQYKYFITFENHTTRWCGDPCTKYVASAEENAAFVVGGNTTDVVPLTNRLPIKDLVIYELMIDDFTAGFRDGTAAIDAVKTKIDYLKSLGVNAVELMPWTAWRGSSFSGGYDPFLFFSVENRYIEDPANPLDRLVRLKQLLNALHEERIHVIMDGVFNHVSAGLAPGTGFPYFWLYQDLNESPFIGGFAGAGYFEEFDYNNLCTQQFIFAVCKYWLDHYKIDGIRFDYTLGFDRPSDSTKGITRLVSDIKNHLSASGRTNVSLMLEHLTDNRYQAVSDTNRIGADGCWYDRLHFDVPQCASGNNAATTLMRVLDTGRDFDAEKGPVTYIENHDHSTVVNRVGGRSQWWKAQVPLISLLTSPGAILIHNGQEFGDDYYLPGHGDDRVISRPLRWHLLDDDPGEWLFHLHQKLIRIRKDHPALRSHNFYPRFYDEQERQFNSEGYGVHEEKDLVIYHRWGTGTGGGLEMFIILLNFSSTSQTVDLPFSENGRWRDLLNEFDVDVSHYRIANFNVSSNWGHVFRWS